MGTPEASVWGCPWGRKALGHCVGTPGLNPSPTPAPVAEKTKEQASHLGGAVFSGAGNIAAATGLVKKEEFPTDLKASDPRPPHATHAGHTCLPPSTPPRLPSPGAQACLPPVLQVCATLGSEGS